MAERTARRAVERGRRARSRRRLRALWLVGLLAVSVYLYYRPLSSYFETRDELAHARTEVAVLRAARERLEQRLEVSTSLEATRREARRIGYVAPGEQLFVVKGIPEWRRARRAQSAGSHASP